MQQSPPASRVVNLHVPSLTSHPPLQVGCESATKTGMVMVFGEITTTAKVDYEAVVRKTCRDIGFTSAEVGLDADKCKVPAGPPPKHTSFAAGSKDYLHQKLGAHQEPRPPVLRLKEGSVAIGKPPIAALSITFVALSLLSARWDRLCQAAPTICFCRASTGQHPPCCREGVLTPSACSVTLP